MQQLQLQLQWLVDNGHLGCLHVALVASVSAADGQEAPAIARLVGLDQGMVLIHVDLPVVGPVVKDEQDLGRAGLAAANVQLHHNLALSRLAAAVVAPGHLHVHTLHVAAHQTVEQLGGWLAVPRAARGAACHLHGLLQCHVLHLGGHHLHRRHRLQATQRNATQ